MIFITFLIKLFEKIEEVFKSLKSSIYIHGEIMIPLFTPITDPISILNVVCCVIGLIVFCICEFLVIKILQLFPKAKMRRDWIAILILIGFFIIGYVVNIVSLLLNLTVVVIFMQAFVYVLGAVFVFVIIHLSYRTYKLLLEAANEKE